jgi:Ca-activated chloride channel family protein
MSLNTWFAYPLALGLLPAVAWGAWALWRQRKRSETLVLRRVGPPSRFLGMSPFRVRQGAWTLALVCISLAAAGPRWGSATAGGQAYQQEIFILLDASASMLARDVAPSRLQAAKRLTLRLNAALRGQRMGLIAFTDFAYVQCPLTSDTAAFRLFLHAVEPRQFGTSGTQLRQALAQATLRFETEAPYRSGRAVVVLTDGEDFGPAYSSVLQRLRATGAVVVPIAIGSDEGGTVPDPAAESNQPLRDAEGNAVTSRPNLQALTELAERTGQPLLRLTEANDPLPTLLNLLSRIPPRQREDPQGTPPPGQLVYLLAGLALALLVVGFLALPHPR